MQDVYSHTRKYWIRGTFDIETFEIEQSIRELRNSKAPSYDGVMAEIVKAEKSCLLLIHSFAN